MSRMPVCAGALKTFEVICLVVMFGVTTGCDKYGVRFTSAADPVLVPMPTEPTYLALPEQPTIEERQTLIVLRDELCRNGFNLVDDIGKSRWVLLFSQNRYAYQSGADTQFRIGGARTTNIYSTQVEAYLSVFKADDSAEGRPLPYWEGHLVAQPNVWRAYKKIIFKPAVDFYGKTFDGSVKLSDSYLKRAEGCTVREGGIFR